MVRAERVDLGLDSISPFAPSHEVQTNNNKLKTFFCQLCHNHSILYTTMLLRSLSPTISEIDRAEAVVRIQAETEAKHEQR